MTDQSHAEPDADPDLALVRRVLEQEFGRTAGEISRMAPGVAVFRAEPGDPADARVVVRLGRALERYAATLDVLARVGHPAARVLPALDGRAVVDVRASSGEDAQALVITWVPGTATPFEPGALGAAAAALGRLHRRGPAALAASADPSPGLPVIERASMLPDNELRFGLRCLMAVQDQVPPAERAEWTRLITACENGRAFGGGLTRVFLHGDAHPWNTVRAANGTVSWIDWDSAGPGPAVIDLAFLAVSCDTGGLVGPPEPADPRRLEAVADGYRSAMTLSASDHDALAAAVAFRVLVSAAVGFASFVRQGRRPTTEPSIRWSLDRWAATDDIAARLSARLGR